MSSHVEEYQLEDGTWSTDRADAVTVDPIDCVRAWVKFTKLPARMGIGIIGHETDFATNERDTDTADDGHVTVTQGPAQSTRSEAVLGGRPFAALITRDGSIDDAIAVLATECEDHVQSVLEAADEAYAGGLGRNPRNPDGSPTDGVIALAAIMKNLGRGEFLNPNAGGRGVLPGIRAYGVDFPASFQKAHPSKIKQVDYGWDAISGGPKYDARWDAIAPAADVTPSTGATWRRVAWGGAAAIAAVLVFVLVVIIVRRARGEAVAA